MVEARAYWLAWSKVSGVGPTLVFRLYQHFGSLALAWQAKAADLLTIDGLGELTVETIVAERSRLDPETLLRDHLIHNPHFWTPEDADYPRLLLEIPDPPPLLYYRGQVNLAENRGDTPAIALVGTRHPSDYGKTWTRKITQTLARAGFTIVSGLAEGVDTIAHESCLEVGGRTIAVMANGLNIAYPPSNRRLASHIDQQGLVLSEHPRGTQPDRVQFPRRNRIIAGLCRATLVLEAPSKSGALITARLANDYGRDVYALPGSLDNPRIRGCLELISKGAQVILDEDHLLEMVGHLPNLNSSLASPTQLALLTPPPPDLTPQLQQVYEAVTTEAIALDQIVQQTGLATGSVLSALMELELLNLVSQQPGMQYCRV